ncbi:MAG: hypothetical protein Kow00108_17240 [Calditrichia bacterium]
MTRIKKITLILLSVIIFFIACSKEKEFLPVKNWIVKVGGVPLDEKYVYLKMKQKSFVNDTSVTTEEITSFIEKELLDRMLLQAEGYRRGYHHLKRIKHLVTNYKINYLSSTDGPLYERILSDKYEPSRSDIDYFYKKQDVRYLIAVIYSKNKCLIDSLSSVLNEHPEKFEELSVKFSEDEDTQRYGRIAYQTVAYMGSESAITGVLPDMEVGEISQPVQENEGYYLIKLFKKEKQSLPPVEQLWENVYKRTVIRKKDSIAKAYIRKLHQRYPVTVLNDTRDLILSYYDKKSRKIVEENIPENLKEKVILKVADLEIPFYYIIPIYNAPVFRKRVPLDCEENLDNWLEYNVIQRVLIYKESLVRKLDQLPKVKEKIELYEREMIANRVYRDLFLDQVEVQESEIKAKYEELKSKLNNQPLNENVRMFITDMIKSEKAKKLFREKIPELKKNNKIVYNGPGLEKMVKQIKEWAKAELENQQRN